MNFRGLIIAVAVLAGLTGVLYWSQHRKPPEETPVTPTAIVLKVNPADVTQITLKQKQSAPVTLDKSANGQWQITEPKPYRADQETVAGMLSTLSGLSADRVVEEKASDRKQYGFDPPAVEVDLTSKGHAQQLLLGDDTPAGGDLYAALAGDPKVFTISSYNKTSLDKSLNDLRDKSLITLDPDKVSMVALIKKPQEIEFDRTKDGWQMLKPASSPAESTAVNELVRSLTGVRMDLTGPGDAAAEFARATPVATAKLTGDKGVQTLEVRKSKNGYYAKSTIVEGAFKVDSSLGSELDKKADDFRQKK